MTPHFPDVETEAQGHNQKLVESGFKPRPIWFQSPGLPRPACVHPEANLFCFGLTSHRYKAYSGSFLGADPQWRLGEGDPVFFKSIVSVSTLPSPPNFGAASD